MERITIGVSEGFAAELAAFMERHHYGNRSDAIRDLARLGLNQACAEGIVGEECVTTLSYVCSQQTRELPKHLTNAHHAHHDFQVATRHGHLDHDSCLEVAVLRGKAGAVREFAQALIAERGVTSETLASFR